METTEPIVEKIIFSSTPRYLNDLYQKLFNIFQKIKQRRKATEEQLKKVEELMNRIVPNKVDYPGYHSNYLFFKFILSNLYVDDTERFIDILSNSPSLQPLVLWTNPATIAKHFELRGSIFLKYNRETSRIEAQPFVGRDEGIKPIVHSFTQRLNEILNDHPGID